MIVKFNVDIKIARKCFALMEMDIPSNEEIERKLSDIVVDISNGEDPDMQQAAMGFTLMAIGQAFQD